MILIKDRHTCRLFQFFIIEAWGNMILIKDRHKVCLSYNGKRLKGKYDTYKGSTPLLSAHSSKIFPGKYDTYKGSTRTDASLFTDIFC